MGKNAYLIISDIHESYKNKENRYNYIDEVSFVKNKIVDVSEKYKSLGYDVYLIFLGDIFDREYKDPDMAVKGNNYYIALRMSVSGMFAVMGNHEFSFYTGNPFYTLTTEIESQKVKNVINKVWTPKGIIPVLRVVDRLEDGEVVFHFNHHKTPISHAEDGKVCIALYHQDVVCTEIVRNMQNILGENIFATSVAFKNIDIFDGYAYNFFGHNHKIYGTWDYVNEETGKKTVLSYLASLGRPNVTEVNDKLLERNIPAVIVEDGHFVTVDDNLFDLPNREECVREEVVIHQKENYKKVKERAEIIHSTTNAINPVEGVLQGCESELQMRLFNEIFNGGSSDTLDKFITHVGQIL